MKEERCVQFLHTFISDIENRLSENYKSGKYSKACLESREVMEVQELLMAQRELIKLYKEHNEHYKYCRHCETVLPNYCLECGMEQQI